jgi:aminotransferase
MIPVFQPTVGWREAWAVARVLRSKWIGRGEVTSRFQAAWSEHIESSPDNVVLLHNCTEALFQSVALFTQPGDSVVVPTIHFIAAGNAVLGQGRKLVLCDVDPHTLMATPETIEPALPKAKMLLYLHYGGLPQDRMAEIAALCSDSGVKLVEDAACAPVTTIGGKAAGTFGDMGCWSFDAMKVLASGNGGAAWVRGADTLNRLKLNAGLGLQGSGMNSDRPKWWKYRVKVYGRSSHMNDITAAMLLEQMKRLPRLILRRKGVTQQYDEMLGTLPWLTTRPACPGDCADSYYLYWIQCEQRDKLAWFLRDRGIYSTYRYEPLHWAYIIRQYLPSAERAARRTLLLPCHANLSKRDVRYICHTIREFGKEHGL